MPVFPFARATGPTTPFAEITISGTRRSFSWRYRRTDTGIDCLVMSAKEATPFGNTDVPVTYTIASVTTKGTARAVTGEDLNEAIMAFVRADRALWNQLAVPNTPTQERQSVTVVRITNTE